jgi:DNA polymerase I-like protein with 3'-5' exonuclease and polymerase domains
MELRFDPNKPKYEYLTTPDQADKALEILEKEKIIGVDIEGTGLDPYTTKLLLVQIGTPEITYIFDARQLPLKEMPRFKELLENPKVLKIMHNGKFDYGFIKLQAGAAVSNIFDTMLTESILTAGLRGKSSRLQELCMQYMELPLSKDVRATFIDYKGPIKEEQLRYSALDTLTLFPIFEQQMKRLQAENLVNIAKLEFAVTRVVAEMELHGVYINPVKWREIIKGLEVKRNEYAQKFQDAIKPFYNSNQVDLFGNATDSINMNSNTQLMDLFNNKLGLNVPSTGDAILAVINHPVAQVLRDYRGCEKLISAFGESLLAKINPVTGRLHPDFIQLGTATGRFSCSNPNLQQIPRNSVEVPFRQCFVPAEGFKLVTTDYSSMEMRILADLSGDAKFIQALKDELDVHSYTASLMFNKPYSKDFKKVYPDLRQAAKVIGFGLMYGMGPQSLARQIDVTPEKGREYLEKYFESYPSVRKFLDSVASQAVKKGWSMTPAGRKRWYTIPDPSDPDYKKKIGQIQREAKNHPIQGTNADVTKYALVFLQDRMKKEGVDGYITHTVHDEIVCEVRSDQAQDWSLIQKREMEHAGELILHKVPVRSDPFVGDVWEH